MSLRPLAAQLGQHRPLGLVLDSFGDHELPSLEVGDVIAIGRAGAYGFTEAMPQFLSHAVPAEVLLLDGKAHVIRERKAAEKHLAGQHLPPGLR